MLFLADLSSFYILIIVIILLCIIYITYIYALFPFIRKKQIIKDIEKLALDNNQEITITKANNSASYTISLNNTTYNIKIVFTSQDIDLQINNIDTWYGYKGQNSKKIKTPIKFIKDASLNNKIIILARHAKTIKKVINESEMIMVKDETDIYNMHILNYNQYDYLIKKCN